MLCAGEGRRREGAQEGRGAGGEGRRFCSAYSIKDVLEDLLSYSSVIGPNLVGIGERKRGLCLDCNRRMLSASINWSSRALSI